MSSSFSASRGVGMTALSSLPQHRSTTSTTAPALTTQRQDEINQAYLHQQQHEFLQSLLLRVSHPPPEEDASANPTPTSTTTTTPLLHPWRKAFGRDEARYNQVILWLVLRDIWQHSNGTLAWQDLEEAWQTLLSSSSSAAHLIVNPHMLVLQQSQHQHSGMFLESLPTLSSSSSSLSPTAGQTLWTLATRLDRALRLHQQPVTVGDNDDDTTTAGQPPPLKRQRRTLATPSQQAVTTVLLLWLATLDENVNGQQRRHRQPQPNNPSNENDNNNHGVDATTTITTTNDTTKDNDTTDMTGVQDRIARWTMLTAGWSKVEESLWLAAWNHALMQQPVSEQTIANLLQQCPE